MDNSQAGQAHDDRGSDRTALVISEPVEFVHADDNLGDEAAFPSNWQALADDAPRD